MAALTRKRSMLLLSLLLLVFLFVRFCVPKGISHLRVIGARRVPASALPTADSLRSTLMQRGESLWEVKLEGEANWVRQVRRHELNSYVIAVRCNDRDFGVLTLGPYVGTIPITYGAPLDAYEPSSYVLHYEFYIPETGRYISQADNNAAMPSYDLSKERLQMCVRIAGGAMTGAYARSNEARVEVGVAN